MTYQLTKMDLSALKQADRLVVAFNNVNKSYRATGVTAIKSKPLFNAKPFECDLEHDIAAPVTVRTRYGANNDNAMCFAHTSLYYSQHANAASVMRTLRVGDEIKFEFYPDMHTTGGLKDAGFHADVILLCVRRNGQTIAEWELDTVICPDNTARMCRNCKSPHASEAEYSLA